MCLWPLWDMMKIYSWENVLPSFGHLPISFWGQGSRIMTNYSKEKIDSKLARRLDCLSFSVTDCELWTHQKSYTQRLTYFSNFVRIDSLLLKIIIILIIIIVNKIERSQVKIIKATILILINYTSCTKTQPEVWWSMPFLPVSLACSTPLTIPAIWIFSSAERKKRERCALSPQAKIRAFPVCYQNPTKKVNYYRAFSARPSCPKTTMYMEYFILCKCSFGGE